MATPLASLGIFIRDLLDLSESNIRLGRENYDRDFYDLQIVIDSIGPSKKISSSESFDGDNERVTYSQIWMMPITIDFYGDSGADEGYRFALISSSQKGVELKRDIGIEVYSATGLTNVKSLTGSQYGERHQMSLNLQYFVSSDVDALRIDSAQLSIVSD